MTEVKKHLSEMYPYLHWLEPYIVERKKSQFGADMNVVKYLILTMKAVQAHLEALLKIGDFQVILPSLSSGGLTCPRHRRQHGSSINKTIGR